jgi:hypothetical protein
VLYFTTTFLYTQQAATWRSAAHHAKKTHVLRPSSPKVAIFTSVHFTESVGQIMKKLLVDYKMWLTLHLEQLIEVTSTERKKIY